MSHLNLTGECAQQAAGFALSLASDIALVTGLGEAAKLSVAAWRLGSEALLTDPLIAGTGAFARQSARFAARAKAAGAMRNYSAAAALSAAGSAMLSTQGASTIDFAQSDWWKDLVPSLGTWRAGRRAMAACVK